MLLFEGYCEAGLFRHLSNPVFRNLQFREYISYECDLLFQNIQNLMQIWKKLEKMLVFEIIASQLVALNCLY